MNRSVMNRQMFAKGGAAFPDLSGDGQVTQRDILMGRGVQFKEQGGPAMPMTREELYGVPQETRQQQLRLRENIMDRGMIPEGLRNIGRAFGLDIESPEGYQRAKEVEYQLMRERELMRQEQPDVRMQEGGMVPAMMDPAMMAPPMDPAMMAPPMMAPPMDPAMQEGIAGQLDPAIVEPLLAEAATRFGSIDEASDYEDLINRVRGDAAPLEARRDELSMFVGDADAAQTPDSVLAMVQPVIQMSGIDQGIGGLAQQAMDVPVEGPMAEGIMSMAAAPEPMPAEMPMGMDQGMGGPAPVNFNQGGAVRRGDDEPVQYYQEAGVVMTPEQEASLAQAYGAGAIEGAQQGYDFGISQIPEVGSLEDIFGQRQESYRNLLGGSEEQKNLTQAQMLFDIANLGLGFAGGAGAVRPGMSPAEQLAASAVKLQTLPTISQRAGTQLEQQQKVDFAAMTAAEKAQEGQIASRAKIQEQLLENRSKAEIERLKAQDQSKVSGLTTYVAHKPIVVRGQPIKAGDIFTVPNNVADNVSAQFGANSFSKTTRPTAPTAPESYVTTTEIVVNGETIGPNTRIHLTREYVAAIQAKYGLASLNKYDPETKRTSVMIQVDPNSPLAQEEGNTFFEAMQIGDSIMLQGTGDSYDRPVTKALAGQYYVVPDDNRAAAQKKKKREDEAAAAIIFATASKTNKPLPTATSMSNFIQGNYNFLPDIEKLYDEDNYTLAEIGEMKDAFKSVDFRTTLDIAKA
jgi:hypothetical protein